MSPPAHRFRLDEAALGRAFAHVRAQVDSGRVPYAALAIGRSDGPIRSETFLPDEPGAGPRRSPIASITKPITATAILQLVEAGSLVLTEPIATYIPEFQPSPADPADPGEPITTWHVLSHTAGLSDATDAELAAAPPTKARLLEILCQSRLRFRPGSAFAYTSTSYVLLAELIERLSGGSYPSFLATRIFEPVGMPATMFDPSTPGPDAVPFGGRVGPPGIPYDLMVSIFVSLEMPGGGLWSTADDLVRFGRAILRGGSLDGRRVLGRPFVDLMTRTHTNGVRELGSDRDPTYALGWARLGLGHGSPAGPHAVGHSGASGSILVVDPDRDLVVVYLRNVWGVAMTATDEAISTVYAALEVDDEVDLEGD
jgi:CubicO group peptidase (beta-lactamase class C family)